jgi:hypothetical protein
MTAKQKTAEEAYIAEHQKARDLLKRIGDLLQDQPAPGNDDHPIHWGHVGNIEHVNTLLQEVVTFLASSRKTLPPWKR